MAKEFTFKTQGVCSSQIHIKVANDVIEDIAFTGGCNGNAQGIRRLVVGMNVKEVIERLKGVHCGGKSTSCPDQLTKALELIKK